MNIERAITNVIGINTIIILQCVYTPTIIYQDRVCSSEGVRRRSDFLLYEKAVNGWGLSGVKSTRDMACVEDCALMCAEL
jgi:hypothetical protein